MHGSFHCIELHSFAARQSSAAPMNHGLLLLFLAARISDLQSASRPIHLSNIDVDTRRKLNTMVEDWSVRLSGG
jgi:hypothetical protein